MNNINSYSRPQFQNKSEHDMFVFLYGEDAARALGLSKIPAKDINLTPKCLKPTESWKWIREPASAVGETCYDSIPDRIALTYAKKQVWCSPASFHAQISVCTSDSSLFPSNTTACRPLFPSFRSWGRRKCGYFCKVATTSIKLLLLFQVTFFIQV